MHKISQNDLSKFSFISSIGSIISTCTCKGVLKEFQLQMVLVSKVTWTHHEFKMPIFPSKKHSCSQTNKIHDFDPENKPWKKPNPNAPCMDYLFTYIMWKMARFQGEMVGKYSLHGTFWEEKNRPFSSTISSTSLATIGGTGGRLLRLLDLEKVFNCSRATMASGCFRFAKTIWKPWGFHREWSQKKKHTKSYWNIYWTFAKI